MWVAETPVWMHVEVRLSRPHTAKVLPRLPRRPRPSSPSHLLFRTERSDGHVSVLPPSLKEASQYGPAHPRPVSSTTNSFVRQHVGAFDLLGALSLGVDDDGLFDCRNRGCDGMHSLTVSFVAAGTAHRSSTRCSSCGHLPGALRTFAAPLLEAIPSPTPRIRRQELSWALRGHS